MNLHEMHLNKGFVIDVPTQQVSFVPKNDYIADIMAQVPGYMYLKSSNKGLYLGTSPAIVHLLGSTKSQEITGKANSQIINFIDHKHLLPLLESLEHYENLVITNNIQYDNIISEPFINSIGHVVILEMKFTPITDANNVVQAVQFYAQDVASLKSPQELLQLYERLYPSQKLASHMFLEHIGFTHYIAPNTTITKRELDTLILFSLGKTAKEIARLLTVSPRTAEKHLDKLKEKINVRNRLQLIRTFLSCIRH